MSNKGIFLAIEGMDASGKTTMIPYLKACIEELGYKVATSREPGGTVIAEEIRRTLLMKSHEPMQSMTEMLLFAASRVQHIETFIKPQMERGFVVISDRFTDSSCAYQGFGRQQLPQFLELEKFILNDFKPDHVLYFNVTLEESMKRLALRSGKPDRLDDESTEFKKRVLQGYNWRAEMNKDYTTQIDANGSQFKVMLQISNWVTNSGLFPDITEATN